MNYKVFLDTQSEQFLSNFDQEPNLRPVVGDTITINNFPTLYKITRQEPTNPTEDPPVTINFFVRVLNSSPDSRTMGRDIAKLVRTLRHLGR